MSARRDRRYDPHPLKARSFLVLLFLVLTRPAVAQQGYQPLTAPVIPARIAFTEQTLANGLHVIYAPRRGCGVAHVRVIYHVGSKNEPPDRHGFAHLFEHMMFRGSAHLGPYEHMRLIDSVGGVCNGETSFDTTQYWETVPAEQLELALWLEADRMASFEPDEAALFAERKVVAQEWAERFDQPFGSVLSDFFGVAFRANNYRWPPIGNMEHLRRARIEELREFFHGWYVPSNAALVIAGGFDVAKTQATVERLFGWIERGPAAAKVSNPPEPPTTRPMIYQTSRPLPAAQEVIGLQTPPIAHADRPALRAMAALLGNLLQHYLVSNPRPMASRLGVDLMGLEDGGLLTVYAELPRDISFEQIEDAIFVQTSLLHRYLTGKMVRAAADHVSVSTMLARETTGEVARELGQAAVLCGSAGEPDDELAAMAKLSVNDVDAAARNYFATGRATILRVRPDDTAAAREALATYAREVAHSPVMAATRPKTGPSTRAVVQFPADYPSSPPVAPVHHAEDRAPETTFDVDGVKVIVLPDARDPGVHWVLALRNSTDDEPPGKEGVAELAAGVFSGKHHSQFEPHPQRFLELHGAQLGVSHTRGHTLITGFAPSEEAAADAIEMIRRAIHDPAVFDADFREMFLRGDKIAQAAALERRRHDPAYLAEQELLRHLAPPRPPIPRRAGPTTRSIMSLTLRDVAEYYRRAWHPDGAVLVFGGEVTTEQAKGYAHAILDGWERRSTPPLPRATTVPATQPSRRPPTSAIRRPRVIVIDAPGALRATIRMGAPAYDAASPDRFAGEVAAHVLGAGVHSRLGTFVRSERGYAYTVGADFVAGRTFGYFRAEARTDAETAADTVATMLDVVTRMRDAENDVTPAELTSAKAYLAARDLVQGEGSMRRVIRRLMREIGNDPDAADRDDDRDARGENLNTAAGSYDPRVEEVSARDVRSVIEKYIRPEAMTVVVVAPAKIVAGSLAKIGHVKVVSLADLLSEQERDQQ